MTAPELTRQLWPVIWLSVSSFFLPPTLKIKTCIDQFVSAHLALQEHHNHYLQASALPANQRPKELRPPTPKHVLVIAQHLHDRMAPWALTDVLLTYLFNHGISVITLHDDIQPQRDAAISQAISFIPKSKFGRYRHKYEWLLPTLKSFSPTTLLSRGHFDLFLKAFTYEELDKWEGAVSTPYCTDLQDLLFALLSLWGAPPLPSFAAQHDALDMNLVSTSPAHRTTLQRASTPVPLFILSAFLPLPLSTCPLQIFRLSNSPHVLLSSPFPYYRRSISYIPSSSQACV